ncbi:MAG: hypothetical protein Q8K11_14740 [Phenylobacterium sp.]|uniref:hypothetical protein n=1 Tax=Phenylobacterium sp. TaxID=1871053 RepID=UPI00272F9C3F|nr:hypothetical protein [Phenylobacterium sp.]MDP2011426.1 hypothetical protein [Phenylobacterium sp.]MDP3634963.1 hypothetical protein [Phenylobacterium sp.]MDP3867711.1 hypothetical protein [Phenylobacterium sp.]
MYRSIPALLGVALLLASQTAVAQSSVAPPAVAPSPPPAVPWCPPGQTKTAAGKCVAPAVAPPVAPAQTPTIYQTVGGVRTAIAGPGTASAQPPVAAKPSATAYAKPAVAPPPVAAIPAAKPPRFDIAVGEPNGDCTTRAPNLIHDSRSPGGCAPCPRGRVPNTARQACVIPIPRR